MSPHADENTSGAANGVPSGVQGVPSVDPRDLTLVKVIGRGTFAQQVALARDRRTAGVFVVKTLAKDALVRRKQVAHTVAEKRVLQALGGHPFIVKLFSAFQTDRDLNFVLEFCQGGELFFHLQQQQAQRFQEPAARFYAAEVLSAIADLHAAGVVYRDLKPENVLLDAQGHVKLADFGFAKQHMDRPDARAFSFCGSPEYLSPEMVARSGHTLQTDLWSFGCFLYELLTGNPPFQSDNTERLFRMIRNARPWFPPELSAPARSLIEALLRVDPDRRPTAEQVKRHAFFRDVDWDAVVQRQLTPPIVPDVRGRECTRNFDDGFTSAPVAALKVPVDVNNKRPRVAADEWAPVRTLGRPEDDFADF